MISLTLVSCSVWSRFVSSWLKIYWVYGDSLLPLFSCGTLYYHVCRLRVMTNILILDRHFLSFCTLPLAHFGRLQGKRYIRAWPWLYDVSTLISVTVMDINFCLTFFNWTNPFSVVMNYLKRRMEHPCWKKILPMIYTGKYSYILTPNFQFTFRHLTVHLFPVPHWLFLIKRFWNPVILSFKSETLDNWSLFGTLITFYC